MIGLIAVAMLQATPPAFEFRQFNSAYTKGEASEARTLLHLAGAPHCLDVEMNGQNVSVCTLSSRFTNEGLSGRPIRAGQAGFDDAGLVLFRLQVTGADVPVIASAMTAKFGPSCRTEERQWRNRLGAVLENPTTVWCLADGELTVETRSTDDPSYGEVRFTSTRLIAPSMPDVDF